MEWTGENVNRCDQPRGTVGQELLNSEHEIWSGEEYSSLRGIFPSRHDPGS